MRVSEVKGLLREAGVRPSRKLGQHFLLREDIARRMVEYADIRPGETVLEVGPGLGILTNALMERADHVVAIEKDPRFCGFLRRRFPELDLIHGDVLRVHLPPFDRVVSNLPFEISSPFTFRLLDLPFRRAVLTYQREFAERLVAHPGSRAYSRLSVKAYSRCESRILEHIPRSAFWPSPSVDAAMVQMESRPFPFDVDRADFERVVDALFAHRRKTVANALLGQWQLFATSREGLKQMLARCIHASRRAEELSPSEIAELANTLLRKVNGRPSNSKPSGTHDDA